MLAALKPSDFQRLKPYLQAVVLDRGAVLHEAGERVLYVYFPEGATISLLAIMANGDAVEAAMVGSEGTVGALAGVGHWHAPSRAAVMIAGRALRISVAHFQIVFQELESIRRLTLQFKEMLFAQMAQTVACNAVHAVSPRLCRWLLHAHDRVDDDVIPLTQEFMSQMLGVTRTTVTEVARELQTAGLIRYTRGRIEILDRRKLEVMACECYDTLRRNELQPRGSSRR